MSNPYAPPEDRPRAPEGAPTGTDGRPPTSPPADAGQADAGAPDPQVPGPQAPGPHGPAPYGPAPYGPGPHGPGPHVPGRQGPDPQGVGAAGARRRRGGPDPDPAATARVSRLAGTFALLVVAAVLVATLRAPWQLASAGFAVLAVVWGIRALTTAWRSGFRGSLPAMLVVGIVVAGGWGLIVLATAVVWRAQQAHEECVAHALTVTATAECTRQFNEDRERELRDRLDGRR